MLHAREDYNRIQDPATEDESLLGEGSSPIGENEPVMLFRAKDKHFSAILEAYAEILGREVHADQGMIDTVMRHAQYAREWQTENGCKAPDMPPF